MSLPLFDSVPLPAGVVIRRVEDRFVYECPHCGGEMSQAVSEEPLRELEADPACCFCRAEFAGLSFQAWRTLPMAVKRTHIPPAGWRAERKRA